MSEKNPKDNVGLTPLHLAARAGNFKLFQYIFNRAEDKNPRDNNGNTPKVCAWYCPTKEKINNLVEKANMQKRKRKIVET